MPFEAVMGAGIALSAVALILTSRRRAEILLAATIVLFATATLNEAIPLPGGPALTVARFASAALLALVWHTATGERHHFSDLPGPVRMFLAANWGMVVLAGISTAWSIVPGRTAAQTVGYLLLVTLLHIGITRRWTQRPTLLTDLHTIIWTLTGMVAAGLVVPLLGWPNRDDYSMRYLGVMNNPNQIAAIAALLTPLALGYFMERKSLARLIPLVLAAHSVVLAGSRTAFLAAAIALAWYAIRRGRGALPKALAAGTAAYGLISLTGGSRLPDFAGTLIDRLSATDATRSTAGDRTVIWRTTLDLWQRQPETGYGFRSGEEVFTRYTTFTVEVSHSSYLQILLELGFLGAVVAGLTVTGTLRLALVKPRDSVAAGLAATAVATLAIAVSESALWATGQVFAWIAWLLVAVLAAVTTQDRARPSDELEQVEDGRTDGLRSGARRPVNR